MPRRGNNIYKRTDGRWEGRIRKDNILPGEAKYKYIYGRTYGETKEKMDIVKQQMRESGDDCLLTMEEAAVMWLMDRKDYWKITTYAAYNNLVRKHIIPLLGSRKAVQIDNMMLEKMVGKLRYNENGRRLADSYLHNICSVVIMILGHIQKKYHLMIYIPQNPIPAGRKNTMILPGDHDLKTLEDYLFSNMTKDGTTLGILTSLYAGLRVGELCALKWENINLEDEIIYIKQTLQRTKLTDGSKNNTGIIFQKPKTVTSMREIPIPPILLPLFKRYRGENSEFLIKGKKQRFAEPRTVEYRFERILEKCAVKKFHFHLLRHTFATRCIARGFDIKSLSELLGHSNIQTTLNLYIHSSTQHKKQLMNLFHFSEYEEKAASF